MTIEGWPIVALSDDSGLRIIKSGPPSVYIGREPSAVADDNTERYVLSQEVVVEKLISFFYKELRKNFLSRVERHNYWELGYVDKGSVEVFTDNNQFILKQGDCIFYKPNELHWCRAHNECSPNLVCIEFECTSPHMFLIEGKTFHFRDQQRQLLTLMIQEGNEAFSPRVKSQRMTLPKRREGALIGAEQLIKNYLEILLITLIRKGGASDLVEHLSSASKARADQELIDKALLYMQDHLSSELSLAGISNALSISSTQLKELFRAKTGLSTIRYFNQLKIEKAKDYIRDGSYTITEIADRLGYSSIHYFSKCFKKVTDMNPTEYAKTVSSRILPSGGTNV